ncbi:MAG: cofactor-independent phosphoglycerate mutase [Dehalococcoidales bacterium]|nr:cofactor-independent phosphoglycerate mutase [Dehalococcoidales bacterium]
MKYCVLIMDGAAGLPIPARGGKTSLELALTPNLDKLVKNGLVGLAKMVPDGLEPDSSVACMSIFGYDPGNYYSGRAPIEAKSLGIEINPGEVLFRCNLVTVQSGKMVSHSAGGISTEEDHELIAALSKELGSRDVIFYPGIAYRNILKLKRQPETAEALCTPPHDIPGKDISSYLPQGKGSTILKELMTSSEAILREHPVNKKRIARGQLPATQIWLFWGSGNVKSMPSFHEVYRQNAAVTSGVSLLRGLGKMAGLSILEINGVTDGLDNDYQAQIKGALNALKDYDLIIVHVESPDEAGHSGIANDKITAIENIDKHMVSELGKWDGGDLRVLVTPDHPTPVITRTHNSEPVPFLLWGKGISGNHARRLTEAEAQATGVLVDPGWHIMRKLIGE